MDAVRLIKWSDMHPNRQKMNISNLRSILRKQKILQVLLRFMIEE